MTHDPLYQLIWQSRPLMQAAETCVEQGLSGTGLTVRMRAVLEILHLHGDLSVPDIAMRLKIKRQYVQLMVNETNASGLVAQRANPRHKRSALICLTPAGRTLIETVIARETVLIQSIAAELDPADVATALHIVQRVTAALNTHAEAGS